MFFPKAILSALMLFLVQYSSPAFADHPTWSVSILQRTESPLNLKVMDLIRKKDYEGLRKMAADTPDLNIEDNRGCKPIHYAAHMGSLEAAGIFFNRGSNLNASTRGGWTPLHYAALGGHLQVMNFLIENGASIDSKDVGGDTPLLYAIETGNIESIKLLVKGGADINHVNNKGETAISMAEERHDQQVVEYLRKQGAK